MTTWRDWIDRAYGAVVGAGLVARALAHSKPKPVDIRQRLAAIPGALPLRREIVIHWDEHQIPFVEANDDDDLPVALGAVHAHLRLGQMELMRRLAFGRMAELAGPLAVPMDRALRLFDFPRAVPDMLATMPDTTRRWVEGFLKGVNHVIATAPTPPDLSILGTSPLPWTTEDLLTVSRLASADVSWIVWTRLLRARQRMTRSEWAKIWPLLIAGGVEVPSPEGLAGAVASVTRAGSNASAVAGTRSRSGAAMLAADPHLSVALPNIWIAAGFRSPSYHAVGLMPAGLPVVAIGRNPWLAWAGTNLHAAGSDLVDVSGEALAERVETIRVRGGKTRTLRLRESVHGPVVSDGMLLRSQDRLALRWMGHRPSDEMGAMLGVLRARSAEQFAEALAGFAVPGQNMIHAGRDGRIGHLFAVAVPRRTSDLPADLVVPPSAGDAWDGIARTPEFPHRIAPDEGFVASANDQPPPTDPPVGYFFAPPDRVRRLRALLSAPGSFTLRDMERLTLDVQSPGSLVMRDAIVARLEPVDRMLPAARALADWDGGYDGASKGALVHEVTVAAIAERLPRPERIASLNAIWTSRSLIMREILSIPATLLAPLLHSAIRRADRVLARYGRWDRVHRLRLRHHLAALPVLGRRFKLGDLPAEGGNDTVNKTGHAVSKGRHGVSYGASARFVTDLGDQDSNRVVLLGGQDGWLGSSTFADQVPDWQAGRFIDLPLRPETARRWQHHTIHTPLAG